MDYLKEIFELLSNNQIQIWTLVATITTTLLWGIYVFFTIKTFKQIKKQTDIQSRAFLLVKPNFSIDTENKKIINSTAIRLKDKWNEILNNNLEKTIIEKKFFNLSLINRGKSDITKWEISISVEIKEGKYLNENFSINGEKADWIIKSKTHQTIEPGKDLDIPIISVGDFPEITISWKISYTDLMNNTYCTSKNFDDKDIHRNIKAFEYNKK
jgi:Ca2+/Na+ antiporter